MDLAVGVIIVRHSENYCIFVRIPDPIMVILLQGVNFQGLMIKMGQLR